MSTNLTRRGLVAAAPAAVIAATLPALAVGTHLDAELLALRKPYERTLAGMDAVSPAHSRAEEAASAAMRAQPDRDRDEVEEEVGLDVAAERWEAAVDANTEVLAQITETPALTLAGILFKAHACARADYDSDLASSIIDDLVAMGGADA